MTNDVITSPNRKLRRNSPPNGKISRFHEELGQHIGT